VCKDVNALRLLEGDEPEHNAGSTRSLNSAARPARLLQFTVSKSAQGQTPRKNDTLCALGKSRRTMGTVVHLGVSNRDLQTSPKKIVAIRRDPYTSTHQSTVDLHYPRSGLRVRFKTHRMISAPY